MGSTERQSRRATTFVPRRDGLTFTPFPGIDKQSSLPMSFSTTSYSFPAARVFGSMACGVLIVDDDADLRSMMAAMLRAEGFDPVLAVNGADALQVLRVGPPPHVILLDLMMPVMDGWQFCEQQQADPRLAGIPVIVATAAPLEYTRALPVAVVLQKPLDFAATIAAIRSRC